jgi:hypothetical protein
LYCSTDMELDYKWLNTMHGGGRDGVTGGYAELHSCLFT